MFLEKGIVVKVSSSTQSTKDACRHDTKDRLRFLGQVSSEGMESETRPVRFDVSIQSSSNHHGSSLEGTKGDGSKA